MTAVLAPTPNGAGGRGEAPAGAGTAPSADTRIEVLRAYAKGTDIAHIPNVVDNVTKEGVAAILSGTNIGFNRQRAGQLVREHDAARRVVPVDSGPAPELPVVVVGKEPTPMSIEEVLQWADDSTNRRIRTVAAKVRALVDDIKTTRESEQARTAAAAEVTRLKQQLAEAEQRLRATSGRTAPARPAVSAATVRAWARSTGTPCPARGQLPASVLAAYRRAHGGAS